MKRFYLLAFLAPMALWAEAPSQPAAALIAKHHARDPWRAIQSLRAQTSLDIEQRLKGGPIYFVGSVEDLYTDGMDSVAVLRSTAKAASIDFILRAKRERIVDLQRANQETGADTFAVVANVESVSPLDSQGRFTAKGALMDFVMEPRTKTQVPNEGSRGFIPQE